MIIKRDADNKWYLAIDWNAWIARQALTSPNGPALTVIITSVSWSTVPEIIQEVETPSNAINGITYFVGSGGVNGKSYDIVATVTYTASELSVTDLTQDRTVSIELENQ